MTTDGWHRKILAAAHSHDNLRAIVLKMVDAKLNRREIYKLFIAAMLDLRAQNREVEEDHVTDELDYISGWCGKSQYIPGLDYDTPLDGEI